MSIAITIDDGDMNYDAYLARSARRDSKIQRGLDDNQALKAQKNARSKVMRLHRGNTNPKGRKLK
jgi:hypothetical protein